LPAMAPAAAAVALLALAAQPGPWPPGAQAHGSRPTAEPSLTRPSGGRTEPPAAARACALSPRSPRRSGPPALGRRRTASTV
jgi:hypothetical protein